MFPYLICFVISCFLIWLGENNRKYFIASKIIFLLALIIPAALAGLRDFSIGIDTLFYGNPIFYDALSSPNVEGMSIMWENWIEPGYLWFNFIVAQFTDDVHWFYFAIMLLQNVFTFLGFYTYRNKLPIWLGMLCYYLFFFTYSLNAIRESFAMSILFFASNYLLSRAYIKYTLWILVALFFHKSVVIAFLLIPLRIYVLKFRDDKAKFILIATCIIFTLALDPILRFILEVIGMEYLENFIGRSLWYLSGDTDYTWKTHIILLSVFFPPTIFFFLKRRKMYSMGNKYHFFFIITIMCLLSSQLIAFGPFAARIGMIFRWFLPLALLMSIAIYKNLPNKQILLKIFIASYAGYYWFFLFVHRNRDETFPYSSSILSSIF